MPWIFVAVVLVCAISFPRFRKVLLGTAALLVGIVAIVYLKDESEKAASKKRISPSEIELADLGLRASYGTSYVITGRVRNRSRYTLSDFAIQVTLEDCQTDTTCDVVFQDNQSPRFVLVPPGQARDFKISDVGPYDLRLKGKLRWNYSLVETRGIE
jgi:hypothetical protein